MKRIQMDVSTRTFDFSLHQRIPATSGYIVRARFRSTKSPKTLIGRVAYESFQTQTDGFGISCRSTRRLRFLEECFIDVEGLLHTYIMPYLYGYFIHLVGETCCMSWRLELLESAHRSGDAKHGICFP